MNRRTLLAAGTVVAAAGCSSRPQRALFALSGHAPRALPPTAASPLSILTLGDSLTSGVLSSDGQGYRRELSARLTAAGVPHTITNSSANGYTAADLMAHGAGAQVAALRPDLVVLAIGTNDAVQSDATLAAFESNYAALLTSIFSGYAAARVCAAFIGYSVPAWMKPREKQINDAVFRQAMPGVGPHGTRVVGVADFQLLADYALLADPAGVHPGDAGYDIMGDIVYRVVAKWIAAGYP